MPIITNICRPWISGDSNDPRKSQKYQQSGWCAYRRIQKISHAKVSARTLNPWKKKERTDLGFIWPCAHSPHICFNALNHNLLYIVRLCEVCTANIVPWVSGGPRHSQPLHSLLSGVRLFSFQALFDAPKLYYIIPKVWFTVLLRSPRRKSTRRIWSTTIKWVTLHVLISSEDISSSM